MVDVRDEAQVQRLFELAQEVAPVRVNVISPGLVKTPLYEGMPAEQREGMYQAVAQKLPVGRVGEPEDVVKAALYLITCGYATRTLVPVDGGSAVAAAS